MVVQYLPNSGTTDNWDRLPLPTAARRAKRVTAARRQRANAIDKGRKLFNRRTLGDAPRIEARLRQAHALYEKYRSAGVTVLELELLD
jgi:hypothetical protein